jgi:hypothetical protein
MGYQAQEKDNREINGSVSPPRLTLTLPFVLTLSEQAGSYGTGSDLYKATS